MPQIVKSHMRQPGFYQRLTQLVRQRGRIHGRPVRFAEYQVVVRQWRTGQNVFRFPLRPVFAQVKRQRRGEVQAAPAVLAFRLFEYANAAPFIKHLVYG
ncbi:MAG: hypothetical protein WC169_06730 [Dehalococcoidia bacterium]